jgi:hypothetical protein
LFPVQKKRGRPKKTDDDYDARLKTPKDVSARNKAGKEDKPRYVLHLTAKHAVSSDKHGILGTNGTFGSKWDAMDAMELFLHKVNGKQCWSLFLSPPSS